MNADKTISYYNSNAKEFVSDTISANLESVRKEFTGRLPKNAVVLDLGCGSGRDVKYFISRGYQVEAADGSAELCRLASEYAGIKVRNMLFRDLGEVGKYDGIWACSSVLHLPMDELADVMRKMVTALKNNGIIYASFKYGSFRGERDGRYFTDMTEDIFAGFIKPIEDVRIEKQWITSDVRPRREGEKWLNLIMRKK